MKKMKKTFFLFLLLAPLTLNAQGRFNFNYDYARFAYDSVSNYVEIYYSFQQNDLTPVKTDSGIVLQAILHIGIQDTASGKFLVDKDWRVNNIVQDTAEAKADRGLVGVIGFQIPEGIYKTFISGSDGVDRNRKKEFSDIVKIQAFDGKDMLISDVQLSSNIKQDGADKNSAFYKNTLEVVPNPTMIFGKGIPVLFYYTEIYNMSETGATNNVNYRTTLINSKGRTVTDKTKPITRTESSRVEVGTINLTKMPTDAYTIVVSVIDTTSKYGIMSSKKFYVYNPDVVDTFKTASAAHDVLATEFNVLSIEECDDLFAKSRYISTGAENDQYKKLDNVEAKRDFLYRFWSKRDQDPSTPVNEYMNEYMNRVRLSNERYGAINRQGMKSDRGRVLILYGEPDEIDRYPNEVDKKPYEVWQYNQMEGGVIFIFGDVTGFSDYELLHSTKRGEMRDDNWARRISTN